MISLALEAGIIAVMTHHVYSYADKTRLQTEGGPIGLELSGAVTRVFMLLWDRKLLRALHRATQLLQWDLFMYLRYVDDSNTACNSMPLGARLGRSGWWRRRLRRTGKHLVTSGQPGLSRRLPIRSVPSSR